MGCVGDELPPGVVQLREPLAHPLEGGGELAELVPAGVHDRLAEISTRDPISRAFQPADAPGEDGRRQVADEE